MDRRADVVDSRRGQARGRVVEYISNLRTRLFNPNVRYTAPTQRISAELFRFRSESDLGASFIDSSLGPEAFLLDEDCKSEVIPSSSTFDVEMSTPSAADSFAANRNNLPALEDGDPIRAGLQQAQDRLQKLSIEFAQISQIAQSLQGAFTSVNQRVDRQQVEIQEYRRVAMSAQTAQEQLRTDFNTQVELQRNLNETMLTATRTQSDTQQTLHNELQSQRERITLIEESNPATSAGVTFAFQQTDADIAHVGQSVANLRTQVEQTQQQLRDEVEACRRDMLSIQTRANVVGGVQLPSNFENLFQSHTTDILRSLVDFDTKSNDSIKRFINTTDLLWNSLEKNATNIERFHFKIKLKLAKCNQTFLHKIENMQWPAIKNEILKDYSVNSARDTLAQINTIKQKSGETLFEFANRCKNLLFDMNSFLGVNADPGMEAINDRSARKAFEDGLSDNGLRNFVKNIPTRNLQELIDITVERFERNLSVAPRKDLCNYCHKGPHKEAECRKKQADLANKNQSNQSNRGNNQNRNANSSSNSNSFNFVRNNSGPSNSNQQNANFSQNRNQSNFGRNQSNSGQNNNNFNRGSGQNGNNRNPNGNSTTTQSFPTRIFETTNPFASVNAPNPYVQMQTGSTQQTDSHSQSKN